MARASDIDRIAVALTLDEIPHALSGDPPIAGRDVAALASRSSIAFAGGLRFRRFGGGSNSPSSHQ
jgi:hypothetical protein